MTKLSSVGIMALIDLWTSIGINIESIKIKREIRVHATVHCLSTQGHSLVSPSVWEHISKTVFSYVAMAYSVISPVLPVQP